MPPEIHNVDKPLICEACNKQQAVGVAAVPGVPCSVAYCARCLKDNNHPMGVLVAHTVLTGGLDSCADWWKQMVEDSLKCQAKTLEWFNAEVSRELIAMNEEMERLNKEEDAERK